MKGVIFHAIKELVIEKFGKEKWEEILNKSEFDKERIVLAASDVDDEKMMKIISACLEVLNLSLTQLADAFGDYWVNVYTQRLYWVYYKESKNAKDFLLKMDIVHFKLTKDIPNARPPRFEYEWKDDHTLIMHYHSKRKLIDLVVGIAKAVGKYYKEDLQVKKLSEDKIEIKFNY